MGYITELTLFDGDAEIYANLGALSTAPHNHIKFNGSGVIKNVLIDTGAELSSYGSLANQGKCEKICLGGDITYVNSLYAAGDIDLNGHKITLNSNASGSIPYFYIENDLNMYGGEISVNCVNNTYSAFQIQGDNVVGIDINGVKITSNVNIFAILATSNISLTDCRHDNRSCFSHFHQRCIFTDNRHNHRRLYIDG